MSNFVTRQSLIPSRIEVLPCYAWSLPPTDRSFIWPEYQARFEAMTPNSSRDKKSWKSFQHYKRGVTIPTLISTAGAVDNHVGELQGDPAHPHHYYDYATTSDPFGWFCNEFGSPGQPLAGLPAWYKTDLVDGFVPDPDDLEGLKQRSLRAMLPLIKDELSVINSIIELKDFKSLPKTISNVRKLARSVTEQFGQFSASSTLRRITRTGADSYLQYAFNVAPTLSDISGVYTALTKTRARITALVNGQGHPQKKHFRAKLDVPDVTSSGTYSSPQPVGGYPYGCARPCGVVSLATRYVYTDVSTFHAEIEYNYNFTQYQTEHAQLLGMLDAFGVNLNPAIIWNAIPWTFVVDWVIGVSRWLNDRRVLNMEPLINIHNYLWSYTGRRRIVTYRKVRRDLIYHDIAANEYIEQPQVPLPVVTESVYRRDAAIPTAGSVILSGLSLREFSLGEALVLARSNHHKRNRSR